MARLNEPPAPVETVEALKRRFIRQNREIARANSTQSLRIRNLEGETSRLLSENLTLREQVINLQNELDNRPRRAVLEEMGLIKEKLEIKLAELGSLVFDLGRAQKNGGPNPQPSRRRSQKGTPKRSPDQRKWENALTLSEVTGGQDGRLPPIVEDKYFPRRTLDSEELLGILSDPGNSADSPDLGPPPVAHFGDGDPVKEDKSGQLSQDDGPSDLRSAVAFMNLETRRRRRESSIGREPGETPSSTLPPGASVRTGHLSGQPIKLGAKRKLSVRDDESNVDVAAQADKDGFRFNRLTDSFPDRVKDAHSTATSSTTDASGRKTPQDLDIAKHSSRDKSREHSTSIASRKALGEKSVNTDPVVSPLKPSRAASDKVIDFKKDLPAKKPRERDRPREKPVATKDVRPSSKRPEKVPIDIEHTVASTIVLPTTEPGPVPPPATPIHPDPNLFSPIPSEPSTQRPDSRDTPPPSDLDPESSTNATTGRTTRRPRGNVSYAEPNLRDKMRRPGKELVDAVGADERVQRAGSVKAEGKDSDGAIGNGGGTVGNATMRTVTIKREEALDRNGNRPGQERRNEEKLAVRESRTEPGSPLSSKTGHMEQLPASVLMERRKRMSGLLRGDEAGVSGTVSNSGVTGSTGSASTIAALVAGTQRKQHQPRSRDGGEGIGGQLMETGKGVRGMDVYDFQGSSDVESRDSVPKTAAIETSSLATDVKIRDGIGNLGDKVRVSRRVSSVAEGLHKAAAAKGYEEGIPETSLDAAAAGKPVVGSLRGRRRRETLANATGNGALGAEEDVEGRPKSRTSKADGVRMGKEDLGTRAERTERAVARRRSMML